MIIPLLLIWVAAAERWRALLAQPRQPRAFYTGGVTLIACAFTVNAYPSMIDKNSGIANSSDLIKHFLGAGTCLAIELYFASLRNPVTWRRAAPRLAVFLIVAALLALTWTLAPVHRSSGHTNLDQFYGDSGYLTLNRLIFSAYLGWCLIDTMRLCHRHMTAPGDAIRSTGLAIISASNALALVYAASRIAYLATLHLAHRRVAVIEYLGDLAGLTALALLSIGICWTSVAPWILRLVRARRRARQLRPIWRRLTALHPETVLRVPWHRDVARRSEVQLTRMVIEILDCLALISVSDAAVDRVNRAEPTSRPSVLGETLRTDIGARPPGLAAYKRTALEILPDVPQDRELDQVLGLARGWNGTHSAPSHKSGEHLASAA